MRLYQDYPGTEIRHLGDYYDDPRYSDYGYIALLNGFDYLVRRGVDKAAIGEASIEGNRRLGLIHLPHPPNYDLWIKIEGCPKRVHIRTSFSESATWASYRFAPRSDRPRPTPSRRDGFDQSEPNVWITC